MADDNPQDGTDLATSQEATPRADRKERSGRFEPGGARRADRPREKRSPAQGAPEGESQAGERISKFISRAGVASRRDVERMIEEGRISLNGQTVTTPVTLVRPQDRITVDGVALAERERTRL